MNYPLPSIHRAKHLRHAFISGAAAFAGAAFALAAPSYAADADGPAQPDRPPSLNNTVQVMVEMSQSPATTVYETALKAARAKADADRANALAHPNAPGSQAILKNPTKLQISRPAAAEVRGHIGQLKQAQEAILPSLTGGNIGGRVLY